MKQFFEKLSPYSIPYNGKEVFQSVGFTAMEILPELKGKQWNPIALGFVHGFKPNRITITTGEITCDGDTDRATVYVNKDMTIKKITLGIAVGLPQGIKHASDLHNALDGRPLDSPGEKGFFYCPYIPDLFK